MKPKWQDGAWQGGYLPVSDKVVQGYLPTYQRIAASLGPCARVCELGIANGESLWLWRSLFPYGDITGVDFQPASCYGQANWPPDVRTIVCRSEDERLPGLLGGTFDLIVDDASHDGNEAAAGFSNLWPLVSPGGYYVIEDWYCGISGHCCYRGPSMLNTATNLLKLLVWQESQGEFRMPMARAETRSGVEDITFRYGMMVVRKVRDP